MIKPKFNQSERQILRNHSDTDIAQMMRADLDSCKTFRDMSEALSRAFKPVCEPAVRFIHRAITKPA